MPFDGSTEFTSVFQRRQKLINALREEPLDNWNFHKHDTCALGMAVRLGISKSDTARSVGDAIGISYQQAIDLFVRPSYAQICPYHKRFLYFWQRKAGFDEITPMMVADALANLDFSVARS